MINKVVLMGGVSEVKEFSEFFKKSKYPIEVMNLYSANDTTVKYLFRLSKPFSVPIGLNEMYWVKEEPQPKSKNKEK